SEKLDGIIALCERKIADLNRTQIIPADREEWDKFLRPALDLSYQALIGAAKLGQEYAKAPSQEIAEGIVYAFMQVDKATNFVEQRLGGVSAETRQAVADELAELQHESSNQISQLQAGHAQAAVSLFDD
ncbi:MAG: hypothetical protein ACAI44_30780, partial [Candidatus Sericytochromatia bacterium]